MFYYHDRQNDQHSPAAPQALERDRYTRQLCRLKNTRTLMHPKHTHATMHACMQPSNGRQRGPIHFGAPGEFVFCCFQFNTTTKTKNRCHARGQARSIGSGTARPRSSGNFTRNRNQTFSIRRGLTSRMKWTLSSGERYFDARSEICAKPTKGIQASTERSELRTSLESTSE